LFLHAAPEAIFDFPDVAPGATVTALYDPVSPAGLYQIVWDQNAPAGFVNSGTFALEAQWWSGDPLGNGQFVASAPTANQPYSTATAAVLEPGSGSILALSILMFGVVAVFRRTRRLRVPSDAASLMSC
jgi:hypothetical protein